MEFSTLIGKPVISSQGESYGYVIQVNLSKNLSALACLVCADSEEEEFIIPASAVQEIGDAVIAGHARLQTPAGVPCPVGKAVYDEHGIFLGGAGALTDGEDGELTVIGEDGERTFPAKRIAALETVIVYDEIPAPSKKPRSQKKPRKPRSKKTAEDASQTATAPAPIFITEDAPPAPPPAPVRITTEKPIIYRMNILGMEVRRTVVGLANQGETVTADMLRRARESNRLLELASSVVTRC